jgi:hypothetical protein
VEYQILDEFALVYVQYSGIATVADGTECFGRYLGDPGRRPGQRQFVDLSAISGFENDFGALFRLQATKASALMRDENPAMMVYLAPTVISLKMAHQILRSWEGLDGAVIRLAEDWDGAMDILGLPRSALDHLLTRTA